MKRITVKGIDDELHAALKQNAKDKGVSMNRLVLGILYREHPIESDLFKSTEQKPSRDDLDGNK